MFEYTYKNHLKFGWGDTFSKVPSKSERYKIEFGKIDKSQRLNFREQCIRAASLIGVSTSEDIWLCFSGGIDSEVVFHALRIAEVPFKVAICKFKNEINEHDIKWARKICSDHDIEYYEWELDIMKFLEGEMFNIAAKYKLITSHAPWHIWLAEQVPGFPVFGGGDLIIRREESTINYTISWAPQSSLVHRFLMDNDREGQPYFFLHTPDLMASFILHPYVQSFLKTSKSMRMLGIKYFKPAMYVSSWPEMIYQRQKYTGLETIKDFDDSKRKILWDKYNEYAIPITFTLDELMKHIGIQGAIDV